MSNTKRTKVEAHILKHITMLDPSGENTTRYNNFFASLSDKDFDVYMCQLRDGDVHLDIYMPNMKKNLRQEDTLVAADSLGLELFERVWLYDSATKSRYLTPEKYLTLKLPVRRLRQFLEKKRSIGESDRRIDLLSGQVVKPDKAASLSQIEMQVLITNGLEHVTQELVKYRGGDIAAYAQYKRELQEYGRTSVTLHETGSVARSAMVFQTLFLGMHLEANVI